MPEIGPGGRLVEGTLQNLGAALVIAIGAAIWQKLKQGSVDWWAIIALFVLTCVVFGALIYFRRKGLNSSPKDEWAGKPPGPVILPHWIGYESEEKWKQALVEQGRKESDASHKEELRRMEAHLNHELHNSREAYRQCMEEKKTESAENANRILDYRNELARYKEVLSPLQFEAMELAHWIRDFRESFEPMPVSGDPGNRQENVEFMMRHIQWCDRLSAHYEHDFAPKVRDIGLRFAKENIQINAPQNLRNIHELDWLALQLVAAAHNLKGPKLSKLVVRGINEA